MIRLQRALLLSLVLGSGAALAQQQYISDGLTIWLHSGPTGDHRILEATCVPAKGDLGHTQQCAYLRDAEGTLARIAEPPPVLGQSLDTALTWQRETRQSGCYCDASSRAHKWGLALETLHYALTQRSV